MRKSRRWDRELEPEAGQLGKPTLARLDTTRRAGVLEDLQRAGGNTAVQRVLGGAQLQRDSRAGARAYVASAWVLSIDGTTVPVRAVEGGGARAEVIVQAPDQTGFSQKRITNPQYAPVSLQVGLNLGGLADWIGEALDNKHSQKEVVVHQADQAGKELRSFEVHDALLTNLAVPKLDVGDAGDAWLRIKLQPGSAKSAAGSGKAVGGKSKLDPLKPSTAQLEISGIGVVTGLRSVEGFEFTQSVIADEVGRSRSRVHVAARSKLDNLVVTVADTDEKSVKNALDSWFQEFAIEGKGDERTAVLTVKSHGGKTLTLTFSGVGIAAAEMFGSSTDAGRKYELYAESMSLKVA